MDIQQKFDNFKIFVKQISHNQDVIDEYQDMTWMKLQALAYVLLLPHRDRLDEIVGEMQNKLDFPDQHLPKFRRYIDLFVEYLAGDDDMSFDDRMELYLEQENL